MQLQSKANPCSIIQIGDGDDDDEEFLTLVAAVEAQAQSKRRKLNNNNSLSLSQSIEKTKTQTVTTEGAYTAALRGSKSLNGLLCQQQNTKSSYYGGFDPVRSSVASSEGVQSAADGSEPSKDCRCGLGLCLVLTANTEKNRGRKFYKCPVREENGGCGFFEWCDNGTKGANNSTYATQTYATKSVFPDLSCACGAGTCLVLTAKTEKNFGQQFYRCPANQENSCGFFKWCSDQTVTATPPVSTSEIYSTRTGSSCFKCGKEGHWAKDCPISSSSSSSSADLGSKSASSGTCYKCGNSGHWAKDCSSSRQMNVRLRH